MYVCIHGHLYSALQVPDAAVHPSAHRNINPVIHLSAHPNVHSSVRLSIIYPSSPSSTINPFANLYSSVHSSTHACFIYPSIHSSIHYPPIHLPTHLSLILPFIHLFINPPIQPANPFIYIHASIISHSFICPSIIHQSIYRPTYLIHPSIHKPYPHPTRQSMPPSSDLMWLL